MHKNPDIYLLYEYMDKIPFTVRMKFYLDSRVDEMLLEKAAQEAIKRFPYFSVKVGLDEGQNYTLEHNDKPISVIPEKDGRLTLGSSEVNEHLFAITYRDNCIWFNFSHSVCGAKGALYWVKTTLYLYMTKRYGSIEAPKDLKLPGTPVTGEETAFPDADKLPTDEPIVRYTGGDTNLHLPRTLKYLFMPCIKDNYFYQIQIPSKEFMDYAKRIDGTPNTILTAMMFKVTSKMFKEKEGTFLAGRIAVDYSKDIGAGLSYRDFIRFVHIRYEWSMKDEPIEKLNMRARGAVITQNAPELSYERFRRLVKVHEATDEQPTLKAKKAFASKNSAFRRDRRATYVISYVRQVDWGGMEEHIKGFYTITDGDLMIEINYLKDCFCVTFQLINKDEKPLELFCETLEKENIPFEVSDMYIRNMPKIQLPK